MLRLPALDRTAATSIVLGIICILLGTYGLVCHAHAAMCPAQTSAIGAILAGVGFGTLLPIVGCLSAYVMDSRSEESQPLLGSSSPSGGRSSAAAISPRIYIYLYASHFATAWGDRMWQFAVPLLLTRFFPTALLPNVLFQLVVYIFLIVTMPHVGAFVDRTNRWHVLRTGIVGMTSMMVVSATALVAATVLHPNPNDIAPSNPVANTTTDATVQFAPIFASSLNFAGTPWPLYTAVAVAVVASAVGQMFNDMQTLALEKDWVVELATATDTSLASWNTALLRIDMATRILSPMAFAFQEDGLQNVISYTGQVFVLVASVAGWNLLLAPLVLATGHDLYDLCPSLGNKKSHRQRYAQPRQTPSSTTAMWKLYLHHPTALVSLSFCLLYLTVLKENALSTAYLLWHGTSAATVGWSMGSGAYCGVMASVVYPWLLQRWEYAETVAVASVWLYAAFLAPALFVVWWPGADDVVLMVVIATSQFWLWTTTLAETQIMQEWVQPHQRGVINAMQHTANKGFYVALLLLGVVFADPHSFRTLVLVSVVATTVAATGFSVWYCRHR